MRIVPCSVSVAKRWVKGHHRHLPEVLSGLFAAACADEGGTWHGVAIAGFGARALNDGRLTITRVATDGAPNACSILYGALCRAAKALGYREVWTYTLPHEPGSSLKASGFMDEGITDPRTERTWNSRSKPRAAARQPGPKRRWRRVL